MSLFSTLSTPEEAMEEGEILRESDVHVVMKGCQDVMGVVLSRLHCASCVPHLTPGVVGGGGKGSVLDLEFAIGVQEGMEVWCRRCSSSK